MRILLIGDLSTDVFIEGTCDRLSPEAPVPVMIPTGGVQNAGMAGNVLANLRSLGPEHEVTALLPKVVNMKVRYVDKKTGHHLLRVDEPDECLPLDSKLLEGCFRNPPDAVVVSDYCKGFLSVANLTLLSGLCEISLVPWFLDTKRVIGSWAKGAILKINQGELDLNLAAGVRPWEHASACLVTNGALGIALLGRGGETLHHVQGPIVEVRDGAGCGDTVLAALVIAYLENGFDLKAAMQWADKAGRVAVSKRGVVAVKREEVL